MDTPKRATDAPIACEVDEGRVYFWCACGLSEKQPFCDGSHKGSKFTPIKYQATVTKKLYFCGCKATENQPLCDGTHNRT